MFELITKKEALDSGLLRYFTGVPCKHGHTSQRYVVNSACCECVKAKQHQRYQVSPDSTKQRATRWYQNNRAKKLHSVSQWAKNNPDKTCSKAAARKASKLQATPPWFEPEIVKAVYLKARELGLEVDHVVPLQSRLVCGLHCWANLQVLSPELNKSKSNREWPDMP